MVKFNQLFLITIMGFSFFSCSEPKYAYWEKGEQLDLAQELSVSEFFQIWIRKDIPWKANVEIIEIYRDENYIYFYENLNLNKPGYLGERAFKKGEKLFKVNKVDLESNFGFYEEVYGIREKFVEKFDLENAYNNNEINLKLYKYKLLKQGIEIKLQFNEKEYQAIYSAIKKDFE